MQNLVYFRFDVFFQHFIGHWSHLLSKIHYLLSAIYDLIYWLIVNESMNVSFTEEKYECVIYRRTMYDVVILLNGKYLTYFQFRNDI
jgi:hypothetical protein